MPRTRIRKSVAIAAAAGCALALAVAAPASAQYSPGASNITISDTTPGPGGTIDISGRVRANAPVQVTMGPTGAANSLQSVMVLGSTTANASGDFTLSVRIPADLAPGSYDVAVVADGQVVSSFAVTLTAAGSGVRAQTGGLPVTGGEAGIIAGVGVALVAGGAGAVLVARRREPEVDATAAI